MLPTVWTLCNKNTTICHAVALTTLGEEGGEREAGWRKGVEGWPSVLNLFHMRFLS